MAARQVALLFVAALLLALPAASGEKTSEKNTKPAATKPEIKPEEPKAEKQDKATPAAAAPAKDRGWWDAPAKDTGQTAARRSRSAPRAVQPHMMTERDILHQLDRRIQVDYTETELQDIIRDISTRTGINMIIDRGVERDKKITLQVKDMPVYKVLRWVMDLSGYRMLYKNEAVLVTTKAEETTAEAEVYQNQLVVITGEKGRGVKTRIYPIGDLLLPTKNHYPPGEEEEDDEEEEDRGAARERLLELIRKVINKEEG